MSSIVQKMKDKLHIGKDKDDVGSATYNKGTETTEATAATPGTTAATGTHATGTNAGTTAGTTAGHTKSTAVGTGSQGVETVVIHERDPHWEEARKLTTGAEQASKVSAAKAYEAQSFLVSAQDAHHAAQEHVNAHQNLVAQAEAEKRNIGVADYLHKEFDHHKKVIEEKEQIHRELNKQLDGQKQIVHAKEGEFGSVAPVAAEKAKEAEALANKLGSIQGAKADLENKHEQHLAFLRQLESQKGQYAGELQRLEGEADQLNRRALDLENQAKQARQAANERLAALKDAKTRAHQLDVEAGKHSKELEAIQKNLAGLRTQESDLANKLAAAKAAAQKAADLAAAKQAELQLAKQQWETERAKGIPIEQDIQRYHKTVQEKERELVEAQKTSQSAKAAYERFSKEADSHAKEIEKLLALKEEKYKGYQERKIDSDAANARANALWEEAKKHGNTGDANALQRLAEAEKQFNEIKADVSRPLAAPVVAPKQPISQGPTVERSEKAAERNDDTSKETVQSRYE